MAQQQLCCSQHHHLFHEETVERVVAVVRACCRCRRRLHHKLGGFQQRIIGSDELDVRNGQGVHVRAPYRFCNPLVRPSLFSRQELIERWSGNQQTPLLGIIVEVPHDVRWSILSGVELFHELQRIQHQAFYQWFFSHCSTPCIGCPTAS